MPPTTHRAGRSSHIPLDDLQLDHRRIGKYYNPTKHLCNDVLLDRDRIAKSSSRAASPIDTAVPQQSESSPTEVETSIAVLMELLDMESAGLQVSWPRHGDLRAALQLAAAADLELC